MSSFSFQLTSDQLASYYLEQIARYPIISIEDGFDQDDWHGFQSLLTAVKGKNVQLVGYINFFSGKKKLIEFLIFFLSDDLTVTNVKRIQLAIEKNACDCLLLKVNQIGSVSEAIAA